MREEIYPLAPENALFLGLRGPSHGEELSAPRGNGVLFAHASSVRSYFEYGRRAFRRSGRQVGRRPLAAAI